MSNETEAVPARRLSRWSLFWMIAGLICWVISVLWYLYAPSQAFIEAYFSRAAYRVVQVLVAPLTNRLPFSLALVLIVALAAGYPLLWAGNWIRMRRTYGRSHWAGLFWGFKWAFFLAPIIQVWFLVFWGLGYQREPAEERLGLNATDITDAESAQLRAQLLQIILRDAPEGPEDRDVARALAAVAQAMRDTVREWDGLGIWVPDAVKATPPGLLLVNGTAGICTPFTLEPHVDGGLPDTAYVSTGAHELGHIAGMCAEAEATLIGFVAGMRAEDPYARYAVALDMYLDLVRQLPREQAKEAMKRLPEVVHQDLKNARDAHARYQIRWFENVSKRAYNSYLQSQGIKEGVKNYAYGISLFIYLWRDGRADFGGLHAPRPPMLIQESPAPEAGPITPANTAALTTAPA